MKKLLVLAFALSSFASDGQAQSADLICKGEMHDQSSQKPVIGTIAPLATQVDFDRKRILTFGGEYRIAQITETSIAFDDPEFALRPAREKVFGFLDRMTGSMSIAWYDEARMAARSRTPTRLAVLTCSISKRLF
jgi:hypothetical protein